MTNSDDTTPEADPAVSIGEDAVPESTPALLPDEDNVSDPAYLVQATEHKALPLFPPPSLGQMLGYALLCAIVGILVSLRALAEATLPQILTPDGYNIQGVLEGLPVPHLLDWNPTLIGLLQQYTTLNPIFLTLGALLVFGFLWICSLSILFPALRVLRPHQALDPNSETSTSPPDASAVALDGKVLLRLTWLLVLIAAPLAALYSLEEIATTRLPLTEIPLQVVWFLAAGIWLRFALRPNGFVAHSLLPTEFSPTQKRPYRRLDEIAIGVVFGIFMFLLQRCAMRIPAPDTLRSLHALGIFHIGRWNELALHYLLSVGLVCFGIGMLFLLFIPLPTRPKPGVRSLVFAGLCIPFALWLQQPYRSQSLLNNWNIIPSVMLATWPYNPRNPASGVPDGNEAAKALASLAHITSGSTPESPDRRFLLFAQSGVYNGLQHGYTEDGLTANLASVPKVQAFLRNHDYNSALSWVAFKHLFNVGNIHFDNTVALRACLDDLEHSPHTPTTETVREMLFTAAATPQNLALLNEWADPARFDPADRASLKALGDLYLRFGEQQKALEWYTRADMPHSFMTGVRSHKPLFHAGQVEGTLLWNGKPLVGVQVGAFPYLQNGLPKDLEGQVRAAEGQLVPDYRSSRRFGAMEPRPYLFRWMSAGTTTDSAGHFTLSYLTEGTYHLVCTLPADVVLNPFQDDRLHLVNAPGDISVRYRTLHTNLEKVDLGKIELTFRP